MRAMTGAMTSQAGAYLCACCRRRVVMTVGCIFERCKSCDGSLFETDWRNWDADDGLIAEPDEFDGPIADEAAHASHPRQWSML